MVQILKALVVVAVVAITPALAAPTRFKSPHQAKEYFEAQEPKFSRGNDRIASLLPMARYQQHHAQSQNRNQNVPRELEAREPQPWVVPIFQQQQQWGPDQKQPQQQQGPAPPRQQQQQGPAPPRQQQQQGPAPPRQQQQQGPAPQRRSYDSEELLARQFEVASVEEELVSRAGAAGGLTALGFIKANKERLKKLHPSRLTLLDSVGSASNTRHQERNLEFVKDFEAREDFSTQLAGFVIRDEDRNLCVREYDDAFYLDARDPRFSFRPLVKGAGRTAGKVVGNFIREVGEVGLRKYFENDELD